MNRCLFALCLLSLLAIRETPAAVVASWDFNDGDLLVDQGAGSMSVAFQLNPGLVQTFGTGTTVNALSGVAAGSAFALEAEPDNRANYDIRFAVDMTGLEDLRVSWAWRGDPSWRIGTGKQSTFGWSADGGASFTQRSQTTPPDQYLTVNYVFQGNTDDNNPDVVFQFFQTPGDLTTGEQFLLDNVTFEATSIVAVPEPSVFGWLTGSALAATLLYRRRA
ncbi:hypothetical protein Mal15_43150 [Stieleria maiorica]|uniref:PEP-CTERM protein-sorting domain-containing protein n=1 Tax=Stieleria maiorica TaxID=2795974 RepID=A0A5B9MKQ0_9BACT|nr:hypothetical protein [Stieleria maiorica]QEG00245.1 hypothetical protein Mal15_43150 [Stieleria maiorica]